MAPPVRHALAWLLFGGLWAVLCANLAGHWNTNPQYSFGWLVPPLAIYLLWRRWITRPQPGVAPVGLVKWAVVLSALVFFPTWLIAQPNPDWRLVNWLLAVEVATLGIAAFAVVGGGGWARHFAFPIAFIAAAVPWPTPVEQPLVQGLMRLVAAITVEALNFLHIPALQHGSLIEVSAGLLGVDEACSGVRSLQAALMAALFLGELSRFDSTRRIALALASIAVAVICNVGRTFFLAWNASHHGLGAVSRWHDSAGLTILSVCFLGVWAVALFIGRGVREPWPSSGIAPARAFPRGILVALFVWFGCVFVATEAWFRSGPELVESRWHLAPPAGSREAVIEPAAARMLQADRTVAAEWTDSARRQWVMYFFSWRPGPSRSRLLARLHRPEECLPAGGWELTEERPAVEIKTGDVVLPFRALTFQQKSRRVFVYFCLVQDRAPGAAAPDAFDTSTRRASLQAVLRRERSLGQQVAELAVFGCADAKEADAAFRQTLPPLLRAAP